MTKVVKLPRRVIHKTPLPLIADAYTIGSEEFASQDAKDKSVYYITFRRILEKINPTLYNKYDNRIIFVGLSRIIDYLFYEATNQAAIDETERCLSTAQVTTEGLKPYPFPKHLWERVVNEFNGRPPISIKAVREGSVVYPNEPVVEIRSEVEGFGEMAAWFESTLLKVWASSEMVTQLAHWFEYCKSLVVTIYGDTLPLSEVEFLASCMLHDFGCRAGICPQESEWLGADTLFIFGGTDTFSGGYQAWKNSNEAVGVFVSVPALAHRNVQGYEKEDDCYTTMYDKSPNGTINSMVSDCYSFYDANERTLLGLAKRSAKEGNGKIVVSRPDSGDAQEQVLWLCKFAHKHGLSRVETILKKEWRFGTTYKFIEGDGMTWESMKEINTELMLHGFVPWGWGVPYGQGGGKRNGLKRDNLSAKYALCAVGKNDRPVCKISETLEKTTLPGPFKLLRTPKALAECKTIAFASEEGEDAMIPYFNGADIWEPYKEGYGEYFQVIKERMRTQMLTMPKTLTTDENHNYPATDKVRDTRIALLKQYAPKKLAQNY